MKTRRLTNELNAAADTIGTVQDRLKQLMERDNAAIIGQRATAIVLKRGRQVAEAMRRLAERYDIAEA